MNFLENTLKRYKLFKRKRAIQRMYQKCSTKKYLTRWEKNFINSIKGNLDLSEKQLYKLQEIHHSPDRPIIRGQYHYVALIDDLSFRDDENSDPRFCERHGVSYDDVHDFDKD